MKTRLLAALALTVFLFAGCSKKEASPLASGTVVQNPGLMLPGYVGDGPYAAVKADALASYYADFRAQLFKEGVTKWDERFDCNHFASYYIAKAQTQYYLANFHATTPAQTLALAEVWYRPGGAGKGHAVVAALVDATPPTGPPALVFVEPQTGQRFQMTAAERQSVFLVKW